jgi:hypothetical protein
MTRAAIPDRDDDLDGTGSVAAAPTRVAVSRDTMAIAQVGEFIDCLRSLVNRRVLVRLGDSSGGWCLDGTPVYTAHQTLLRFALVESYRNPEGFEGVVYFRLTPAGRRFADDALSRWAQLPWWQRMWLRATA